MLHISQYCNHKNEDSFRWGSVTYCNSNDGSKASLSINRERDFSIDNVKNLTLKPFPVESLISENSSYSSLGTKVIISWFPLPANKFAYIKCEKFFTQEILENLLQNTLCLSVTNKGDIRLPINESSDEMTVRKTLKICCDANLMRAVIKVTVPSKRLNDVDKDVEKEKLLTLMKNYPNSKFKNIWIANCQKVMASVEFENMSIAESFIDHFDAKIGVLGVRAMYAEFDSKRDFFCDMKLYKKIQQDIADLRRSSSINVDVEQCKNRMKITVSSDNCQPTVWFLVIYFLNLLYL